MSLARKNEEAAANLQESEEAAANLQEAKEFKEPKESKEWRECNRLYCRCNASHRCVETRIFLGFLAPFLYYLPNFTLVTCPISPESEVMSCEQFPPHPAVYKAN